MKIRYITYIYLLILLLGSVLPINSGSSVLSDNYTLHIRWDYLLHALVYLPLPVLMALILPALKARYMIGILLLSLIFAAGLELLQMLLPFRSFNINDMVANGAGVCLGFLGISVFRSKYFKYT